MENPVRMSEKVAAGIAIFLTFGVGAVALFIAPKTIARGATSQPIDSVENRKMIEGKIVELKLTNPTLAPSYMRGGQSVRIVPASLIIKVLTLDGKTYIIEAGSGSKQMPETLSMLLQVGDNVRFPTKMPVFSFQGSDDIFSENGIGKMSSDSISIVR